MKQTFCIILAFSILMSCHQGNPDKTAKINSKKVDSVYQNDEPINTPGEEEKKSFSIKDSSDYSAGFLKEMKKSGMNNVSLVDSYLILGHKDTVTFPQTPAIGKKSTLTAKKNNLAIALNIERINQTTIKYKVEMVELGEASYIYQGQADLNPRFYLGSETDESSLSGTSYLSTEFIDSQDSCYTYIRIGREEGSGPYLLGKIIKNCNGKIQDIGLDNFPTLIEK